MNNEKDKPVEKDKAIENKTDKAIENKTDKTDTKTVEIPLNQIETKVLKLITELEQCKEEITRLEAIKDRKNNIEIHLSGIVDEFNDEIRDSIKTQIDTLFPTTNKTDNTDTDKTDTKTNKSKYSEIVSKYMSDNKLTSIPLSKAVEITGYTGLYPVNLKRSLEKAGITVN